MRLKTIADVHLFIEEMMLRNPALTSMPENMKIAITVSDDEWFEIIKPMFTIKENIIEMTYHGIPSFPIIIRRESNEDKFTKLMKLMNRAHHSKGYLANKDA